MLTYSLSRGPLDTNLYKQLIEINLYGSIYVSKYAAISMSGNKPVGGMKEKGIIILLVA